MDGIRGAETRRESGVEARRAGDCPGVQESKQNALVAAVLDLGRLFREAVANGAWNDARELLDILQQV